jgi:hypothetical protein
MGVPVTASCKDESTLSDPETASNVLDCSTIPALLDAVKVKAPEPPAERERDDGKTVTPKGKPVTVTVTDPAKPFWAAIETWTVCAVPPGIKTRLVEESETVKLGSGGTETDEDPLLPPPHPAKAAERRIAAANQKVRRMAYS